MLPASDSLRELTALVPAPPGAAICARAMASAAASAATRRARFSQSGKVLVAHAAFVAGRLKAPRGKAAVRCAGTVRLCAARPAFRAQRLGPGAAAGTGAAADAGRTAAQRCSPSPAPCWTKSRRWPPEAQAKLAPLIGTLARAGWRWAPLLQARDRRTRRRARPSPGWKPGAALPQWEDEAPAGTPGSQPVEPEEASARLMRLVGTPRPEQAAYSEAATYAFGPREDSGAPRIALVEAGTGTGKTLGYLAPASLWAEKNGPGLWISTYTRNLQRQIVQEIAHLYPDPVERAEKAVVRKGRENYLCLLNFEEAAKRTALAPGQRSVALGLIARWIASGTDGDISGAGFPAFLAASMPLSEVTDRRGECIYAACPHYRICFIERAIRRARHAPIVVANHALVIAQARAATGWRRTRPPTRRRSGGCAMSSTKAIICSTPPIAASPRLLSGREMAELRRWIRGPEGRARTRMRGLEERLKDLIADDEEAQHALDDAVQAAGALAGEGWMARVTGGGPRGPGEVFLAEVYRHVRARSDDRDAFYTLEAEPQPLGEEAAARGARAVARR